MSRKKFQKNLSDAERSDASAYRYSLKNCSASLRTALFWIAQPIFETFALAVRVSEFLQRETGARLIL